MVIASTLNEATKYSDSAMMAKFLLGQKWKYE